MLNHSDDPEKQGGPFSPWSIEERVYQRLFNGNSIQADIKRVESGDPAAPAALLRLAEWDPTLLLSRGSDVVRQKQRKRDAHFFKLLGEAIKRTRCKKYFLKQREAADALWFFLAFRDSHEEAISLLETAKGRTKLRERFEEAGLLSGKYQDDRDFDKFLCDHGFLPGKAARASVAKKKIP